MALSLREKQTLFARLIAQLITFVFQHQSWGVTLGEGHNAAGVGHMKGSLHYSRLAQDLNLFVAGKYITSGSNPAWTVIGEYWETLNPLCRWGGRFNDANHFSLAHAGKA